MATSKTGRQGAERARRISPRRSRRSAKSAGVTERWWPSSSEPARTQISLTDPDSRAMAAHTKVGVGYNIQVAVDAKHKLIVEQAVTNQVVDMGLLTQTAEPAREFGRRDDRCRRRPRLLQDRGHRGLREGRLHPARSQTATRLLGPRGLLSQGRVSLRRGARRLCLPGREGADADPPRPAARSRQSRLRQSRSLS